MESESRMVGASGLAGVMERHCFNGVNVWCFAKWKKSRDECGDHFGRAVLSDSLWPYVLQYTRLPCLSPTPEACSNSYPSSWWCHPTISSSVIPFSSHLQYFPALGCLLMSEILLSGGQSIAASASVLPMNIQDLFPLGLTGLISLQFKGLSRVFTNTTVKKHQFFSAQLSFWSNSHIHTWLLEKPSVSSVTQSCQTLCYPMNCSTHRLPSASPTPGACSNSCPSSQWCHPTILSSVIPFSFCLQSFPATGFVHWVSSSHQVAEVLEFQLQHQSFIGRTDFLYNGLVDLLAIEGILKSLLQDHRKKHQFFIAQPPLWSNSHTHTWLLGKT